MAPADVAGTWDVVVATFVLPETGEQEEGIAVLDVVAVAVGALLQLVAAVVDDDDKELEVVVSVVVAVIVGDCGVVGSGKVASSRAMTCVYCVNLRDNRA